MQQRPTNGISNRRAWEATMAYVFRRPAKDGKVRFTAMYKAENGQYRSAGTYDDEDRAQQVADESERHAHLQLNTFHQEAQGSCCNQAEGAFTPLGAPDP